MLDNDVPADMALCLELAPERHDGFPRYVSFARVLGFNLAFCRVHAQMCTIARNLTRPTAVLAIR